jgi:hypothetical protein
MQNARFLASEVNEKMRRYYLMSAKRAGTKIGLMAFADTPELIVERKCHYNQHRVRTPAIPRFAT